jgi:hypothetical protein
MDAHCAPGFTYFVTYTSTLKYKGVSLFAYPKLSTFHTTGAEFVPPPIISNAKGYK